MFIVGLILLFIGFVSFASQLTNTYQEYHDTNLKIFSKLVSLFGILDVYLLSVIAILIGLKLAVNALFH